MVAAVTSSHYRHISRQERHEGQQREELERSSPAARRYIYHTLDVARYPKCISMYLRLSFQINISHVYFVYKLQNFSRLRYCFSLNPTFSLLSFTTFFLSFVFSLWVNILIEKIYFTLLYLFYFRVHFRLR